MKPIKDILIKVSRAYKNSIELKGGLTIFLDQNIKQVKDTIRYGEVVGVPSDCGINVKVGDTLFFHHNIVTETVMEGRPNIESSFLVDKKKGLYRVPIVKQWPMAYAVVRNGEFKALDGICFVRQIKGKKYDTTIYVPNNEKEVRHIGELVHKSPTLEGLNEGDKVIFERDSEYKFYFKEETLYGMFDKWILAKVDEC
jgi:co-chaperonin GroES (HSP10)